MARPSYTRDNWQTMRDGMRLAAPLAPVIAMVGLSFGVLTQSHGWPPTATVVASVLIFSGSAQFALAAVLASGGTALAAVAAAGLVNARYLPMGAAVAPALRGGAWRRAVEGQSVVDAGWAFAHRGDGTFDRGILIGAALPQYGGLVLGTVGGVLARDLVPATETFGLDVVFPAFFVTLLLHELKAPRAPRATLLAALITLALIPFTPAGVPIVVAGAAALLGLKR
jgi:predicted branched-subunit amino acid permease